MRSGYRRNSISAVPAAIAALASAGLMFLLDPRSGRRRRALLRDQLHRTLHESQEFARKAGVDARNRMHGLLHRSRSLLHREAVSDDVIVERVRAALGRLSSHPGAIEVFCTDGVVHLRGDILASEVPHVVKGVRHVRGVKDVVDELRAHESPRFIPALQGGRYPVATTHFEYLQENWSPAPRALAGVVGLGLLASSLGRSRMGIGPATLGVMGAAILTRAITNRPLSRLLSLEADAEEGFLIQKSLEVNTEVNEVYAAWRALENFPTFMSHIREVTRLDERRYKWRVDGPGGVPVTWEAEITADVPNELIAWRTVPGSAVQSSGIVQFEPTSTGGTRINIRMRYQPPADAVGHAAARLFGRDPRHQIDEDLLRFKSMMEAGKTGRGEGPVVRH
jgi:uncharacterized membrane protein